MSNEQDGISGTEKKSRERGMMLLTSSVVYLACVLGWFLVELLFPEQFKSVNPNPVYESLCFVLWLLTALFGVVTFITWIFSCFSRPKIKYWRISTVIFFINPVTLGVIWCLLGCMFGTPFIPKNI